MIREYLEGLKHNRGLIFYLPFDLYDLPMEQRLFYMMIEQVTFMDLYKQMQYKLRMQDLVEKDFRLSPWVDGIYDLDCIHQVMISDPSFLKACLDASSHFYNANALEKFAQVKSMSEADRKILLHICPNFEEDLQVYDRTIYLEDYYKYFSRIADFYDEEQLAYCHETIEKQIGHFIQNLYTYDKKNSVRNILELSVIDYEWTKEFIHIGEYPDIASGRQNAMHRINFFESSEDDELIERSLFDMAYLTDLLDTYFYVREIYKTKEGFAKKEATFTFPENHIKEKIKRRKDDLK